MAIAIVGTPAYQHYDSFVENAHTLSVTVPSGAEALLIGVTINNDVWTQLTSLTFNGTSVGTHVGTTPNSVANRSCRWYAVTSPAAGTFNIVATYSTSSNNKGGMLAVCLTGVNSGSLIADAQAASTGSGSSPLSTSVTSPTGSVAFAACYADTQQPTPSAGQTTLGTNEQNHCFSYKLEAASMGVTFTGAPQIAQSVIVVRAAAGGDTTAPTLTSPTGSSTGSTTAAVGATTDEGNGTLYAVVTTSATAPTKAQIKAGQNAAGSAANWSGSLAVSSTGAKTLNANGLTASTTYYAHLMHEDAATNQSNVVSSTSFTTSAGASGSKGRFYYQFGSPQC